MVIIIIIAPTIGSKNELVELPTPTSPLATTSASLPPEEDKPNADLSEVNHCYDNSSKVAHTNLGRK